MDQVNQSTKGALLINYANLVDQIGSLAQDSNNSFQGLYGKVFEQLIQAQNLNQIIYGSTAQTGGGASEGARRSSTRRSTGNSSSNSGNSVSLNGENSQLWNLVSNYISTASQGDYSNPNSIIENLQKLTILQNETDDNTENLSTTNKTNVANPLIQDQIGTYTAMRNDLNNLLQSMLSGNRGRSSSRGGLSQAALEQQIADLDTKISALTNSLG